MRPQTPQPQARNPLHPRPIAGGQSSRRLLPLSAPAHLAEDDPAPIVWMVHASQAQTTRRASIAARMAARARELLRNALVERSSPREIGHAAAAGVFAACTPFGFHAAIALALATAFRLNRLLAFAASRVSILPVYLVIAFCEIEAGHLLRRGQFAHLTASEAFAHRYELLTEWLIGTVALGGALAAIAGWWAYAAARAWQKAQVSSRRLDGPRPPSSESPSSAPRDRHS
jgi:uncharacterized protein (DUF2062 family)